VYGGGGRGLFGGSSGFGGSSNRYGGCSGIGIGGIERLVMPGLKKVVVKLTRTHHPFSRAAPQFTFQKLQCTIT